MLKCFFRRLSCCILAGCLVIGLSSVPVRAEEQELVLTDTLIEENATWSGKIAVRGVVVVRRGVTLKIEPGTTVRFFRIDTNNDEIGDSELRVLGRILAKGTKENPITFRSAEDEPKPKDWSYVLVFSSAEKNEFQYCRFQDAFTGLQVHFSSASVSDSVFTGNNEGLRFGRAKFTILHNLVENNNLGIRFTRMEGPVDISGNIVTGNRIGVFLVPSSQNIVDFFEPGRTGKPWNEGHLEVRGNNIFGNEDYDLNLGVKQKWDLAVRNNWWGTTDPDLIQEKIFDKTRDPELGTAIFAPFLQSPVAGAGPR